MIVDMGDLKVAEAVLIYIVYGQIMKVLLEKDSRASMSQGWRGT